MKSPKGIKGTRRKLLTEALQTNRIQARGIAAASAALDRQTAELLAYRRIVISERAQVIFYTERCIAYAEHRCLDLKVPNFLDQPEKVKEDYIRRAVQELSLDEAIVPHDPEAQKQLADAGKIILPGDRPN